MPGVSIHVVDVSRGLVGEGMRIEFFVLAPRRHLVAGGAICANGTLSDAALDARFVRGEYEAVFHVGAWYRAQGVALPRQAFLDVVNYRFGIDDPEQHYHLPFKCTPWGYSCFRGGK
ncbi:MAG: hydroxyisourate hydrolase [Betaproteobacteria bacterium]|nr:hydroxyisourate hydrolase [Betaproteobacteria bacterium]